MLAYATDEIKMIDAVQIIGKAIRTGHHCTQPLMEFYQIPGTARASFAFYNSMEEVDYFISSLKKTIKLLS